MTDRDPVSAATDYLRERLEGRAPAAALILGSGLGALADEV
ncbi:MAG: purine-nucleoside phosphorylase, partial [Gammaproteobacteria bacterium]|nr:purine-nucleoside phosphorylase [Gemmatimonadota bacterium]NIU73028.1 purine-nucleoside phosphorylase [Gammaproteobacteria bacterium]NIY07541.1 purine-nucleoside phosphorylase [Gemmatimonadota bacterium]